MNEHTEIVPRSTVLQLAGTYRQAVERIGRALAEIAAAEQSLYDAFLPKYNEFSVFRAAEKRTPEVAAIELEFRKAAWRTLVDRLELKKCCTEKRAEEIDRQLDDAKNLPEITPENMLAMLEQNVRGAPDFLQELVREVFDSLRPRMQSGYGMSAYKTNRQFEVGPKFIKHLVGRSYGGRWRVGFHRESFVRALDNVFHLLDGKGAVKTHYGPLFEAIDAAGPDGRGETEYFKFRCFLNGNLHCEFKRLDLLAELNRIGGGGQIKPPQKNGN